MGSGPSVSVFFWLQGKACQWEGHGHNRQEITEVVVHRAEHTYAQTQQRRQERGQPPPLPPADQIQTHAHQQPRIRCAAVQQTEQRNPPPAPGIGGQQCSHLGQEADLAGVDVAGIVPQGIGFEHQPVAGLIIVAGALQLGNEGVIARAAAEEGFRIA